jgi:hypothetical protein
MHKLLLVTSVLFALCALSVSGALAQAPAAPDAAARQWLTFIDGGDYAKGWVRAGSPFKAKMTAQVMQGKIEPARAPLGAIMQRRLANVTYASSAPGLPDANYAVVQFRSRFAGPSAVGETVWLVSENDRWMVIGYFIGAADPRVRPASVRDGGAQAPVSMYAVPPGKLCSHQELVQARIARMNGYTGAPVCANGP